MITSVYKTFRSTIGAMAWRFNTLHVSPMTQLAMKRVVDGLSMGALINVLPTVWTVTQMTVLDGTDICQRAEKEIGSSER